MSVAQVLRELHHRRVILKPDGDDIICEDPYGSMTSELLGSLHTYKREILERLNQASKWDQETMRLVTWFKRVSGAFPDHFAPQIKRVASVIELGPRHMTALSGELGQTLRWLFNTHAWYEDDSPRPYFPT